MSSELDDFKGCELHPNSGGMKCASAFPKLPNDTTEWVLPPF